MGYLVMKKKVVVNTQDISVIIVILIENNKKFIKFCKNYLDVGNNLHCTRVMETTQR